MEEKHILGMTFCFRAVVALFMTMLCISTSFAQSRRAFLVGISKYGNDKTVKEENVWSDIHGTNDVELLVPTLKKQGYRITKLCNKDATASKIRKGLSALASSCCLGDMIYVHFSCHGQPVEDLNGDESDGWDEAIVPYDAKMVYEKGCYEGANHILDDELHGYLQKIRKAVGAGGFICVVVDACHAGGSSRGDEEDDDAPVCRGTKRGFTFNDKDYHPRIDARGHFTLPSSDALAQIMILEACRSYQSNYEIKQDGRYYGPLSFYVNRTMQSSPVKASLNWVKEVKQMMDADKRLMRQNMVYETSLK